MADFDYQFLIEGTGCGLLSGVMYSLVAIGFVLVYKTSGVLNFAQGSMLLFAALTFVSLIERHVPFVLALAVTFAAMVLLGIAIERLCAASARQQVTCHSFHGNTWPCLRH